MPAIYTINALFHIVGAWVTVTFLNSAPLRLCERLFKCNTWGVGADFGCAVGGATDTATVCREKFGN
jgi:hypothetical protein